MFLGTGLAIRCGRLYGISVAFWIEYIAYRLTSDDFEVAFKRTLQHWLPEEASVWDITHEELNDNEELMHSLVKTGRCFGGRSASSGLLQVLVRIRVVELDCFNTP